jgi:hypothetical protein
VAAPVQSSLEVVSDTNGFLANFWRAVQNQPDRVMEWVSHIDLSARHRWLMSRRGAHDRRGLAGRCENRRVVAVGPVRVDRRWLVRLA